MAGLLEELLKGFGQPGVEHVSRRTGTDPRRAEEATGAALSTILRGLERKARSPEGAQDLWKTLESQANHGHVQVEPPTREGVEVQDLDPKTTDSILKDIFGQKADQVEHRYGKVVRVDPETTKKIFGAVLPIVLGMLKKQAEAAPKDNTSALPDILTGAREEMQRRQPKSGGILEAILDRDHDGDVDLGDLAGIFLGGRR
jgi:hypothetical protein